jgi:hypothetical protein
MGIEQWEDGRPAMKAMAEDEVENRARMPSLSQGHK